MGASGGGGGGSVCSEAAATGGTGGASGGARGGGGGGPGTGGAGNPAAGVIVVVSATCCCCENRERSRDTTAFLGTTNPLLKTNTELATARVRTFMMMMSVKMGVSRSLIPLSSTYKAIQMVYK